jgi:hypothetical protein
MDLSRRQSERRCCDAPPPKRFEVLQIEKEKTPGASIEFKAVFSGRSGPAKRSAMVGSRNERGRLASVPSVEG